MMIRQLRPLMDYPLSDGIRQVLTFGVALLIALSCIMECVHRIIVLVRMLSASCFPKTRMISREAGLEWVNRPLERLA